MYTVQPILRYNVSYGCIVYSRLGSIRDTDAWVDDHFLGGVLDSQTFEMLVFGGER